MNTVREYRMPLMIGAGALVVALLLWAILVSPQSSKLSSLQNQAAQLQTQEVTLQAKLTSLKAEKQNLTKSCADLQKIATQIPTVQTPTDIDAEESSFESQFNTLAGASGVSLSQFSGFAPASTVASTPTTPGASTTPAGVVAVPTTLAVTGNYSQISAFIVGLDSFPRLFVIQNFNLVFGSTAISSAQPTTGASSNSSGTSNAASASAPPLWTGGAPVSPTAGPYGLSITGSIYYTTSPNALAACTKATTTLG